MERFQRVPALNDGHRAVTGGLLVGVGTHVDGDPIGARGSCSGMRQVSAGRRESAMNQDWGWGGPLPPQIFKGRIGRFEGSGATNWTMSCSGGKSLPPEAAD